MAKYCISKHLLIKETIQVSNSGILNVSRIISALHAKIKFNVLTATEVEQSILR